MKRTLRALAALLGYPSADLKAHVGELRQVLREEGALPRPARRKLEPLLDRIARDDLLELQAAYSELFDRARSLSLHLFEHVHGDSRERGQAMIDLGLQYIDHGCMLESRELPDFIPVFLEFASCLEPAEMRETLGQPAHVFAALEERLQERGSDYAAVFRAIQAVAGTRADPSAVSELSEGDPGDDPTRIDEEWEEAPVSFSGTHDMGGPTGMVAKIRAAGKAMTAARRSGGGS